MGDETTTQRPGSRPEQGLGRTAASLAVDAWVSIHGEVCPSVDGPAHRVGRDDLLIRLDSLESPDGPEVLCSGCVERARAAGDDADYVR